MIGYILGIVVIILLAVSAISIPMILVVLWFSKRARKHMLYEYYKNEAVRFKAKNDAEKGSVMSKEEALEFIKENGLDKLELW